MPVLTIPETLEEGQSQKVSVTEHTSEGAHHEGKSTADSPSKGHPEENCQASPHIETNNQVKEDLPKVNDAAIEGGSVDQNQTSPPPDTQTESAQQDPKPANNEGASNQRSPSPEHASMDQYFESSNEDDIPAQPGGFKY
jgi:hypothetical protein